MFRLGVLAKGTRLSPQGSPATWTTISRDMLPASSGVPAAPVLTISSRLGDLGYRVYALGLGFGIKRSEFRARGSGLRD